MSVKLKLEPNELLKQCCCRLDHHALLDPASSSSGQYWILHCSPHSSRRKKGEKQIRIRIMEDRGGPAIDAWVFS